jgi:hypothetical protein
MMVRVATEKSKGHPTATVPVHRDFAVSLAAARNAGILGTGAVFTGKLMKGEIAPMNKKAWAGKFKKFARLAGVNEPKKNCHGVRKARAEVAAYSECTEAQMMAMFGWRARCRRSTSPKRTGTSLRSVGRRRSRPTIKWRTSPIWRCRPTRTGVVTFESNRRKNPEISTGGDADCLTSGLPRCL